MAPPSDKVNNLINRCFAYKIKRRHRIQLPTTATNYSHSFWHASVSCCSEIVVNFTFINCLIQSAATWWKTTTRFALIKDNKSSAVGEMGDRLATIDMGRKWGRAAVVAGSPCGLSQGLPLYQVASWSIQPFGHNCRNATLLRVGIRLPTILSLA